MNVSLTTVLLFSLVIPFVLYNKIAIPNDPVVQLGIIFFLLAGYAMLDILVLRQQVYYRLKYLLLWLIIALTIGAAFYTAIAVRRTVAPSHLVHDIVLQQEVAVRLLLLGKNPYSETYFHTDLEYFPHANPDINPALYHFVMEPLYLLFSLPFYKVSAHFLHFFDGRLPLYFLFFSLLVTMFLFIKDKDKKQQAVILMAFNPATLSYLIEGRSDFFMFPFLYFSLVLLFYKRFFLAGILLACACAVKQSAWFLVPFYITYLFFLTKDIKKTVRYLIPFLVVFFAILGPFFLWDPKAFLDSTIFYLSGTSAISYPVSGYGFGMILREYGVITNPKAYYPFILWQIIFCLPLFEYFLYLLYKRPSIRLMLYLYGLFLFVFWYFSRYFNNSHIAYISTVLIAAYFWPEEEKDIKT